MESRIPALPGEFSRLRLEAALSLLNGEFGTNPVTLPADGVAYLQAIIDALCDLSLRDALTGLANARHFRLVLERELDRAGRTGECASLCLIDVDYFKQVNDTHGHPGGDEVLRTIGAVLVKGVRPMDF